MKTKTNKLSAIEEMRVKRACLRAKEQNHLDELNKHINYLQNHWGALLINSGVGAVKSQAVPLALRLIDILPVILNGTKFRTMACILKSIKDFVVEKK